MKIVYVPQHIYGALKQAGLASRDLCDVGKLLGTLSAEDVAFYFYANTPGKSCPIPKPLSDYLPNLFFHTDNGAAPFDSSDPMQAQAMRMWNSFVKNGSAASLYEKNSVLTSDCSEEDLLILTHVAQPDAAEGEKPKFDETAFYDRVIQQLLAFKSPEQVMASPVLTAWLKSVRPSAA